MSAAETETAAGAPKRKRRPHHGVSHIDRLARENEKLRAAQIDREMSRAARLEERDRAYAAALAANGILSERVEVRPDGRTVRTRGCCAGCAFASSRRAVLPTDAPLFADGRGRPVGWSPTARRGGAGETGTARGGTETPTAAPVREEGV